MDLQTQEQDRPRHRRQRGHRQGHRARAGARKASTSRSAPAARSRWKRPPPRSRKATGRKVVADTGRSDQGWGCSEFFVRASAEKLGRIDIMINNAGSAPGGVIETLSEEDWSPGPSTEIHGLRSLSFCYALPIMVKQGGGRVVNLIGNDGVKPSDREIAPGAANAAGQKILTKSLAGQYGKHGISFVAVNPGPVRTERWDGLVISDGARHEDLLEDADRSRHPRSHGAYHRGRKSRTSS